MSNEYNLAAAAAAWREGRLTEAYAAYRRAVKARPNDWCAAFQLAWIDAAFGRLPPADARGFSRPDLSEAAHRRVAALMARSKSATFLDGSPEEWDIESLARTGAAGDETWWLDRGKRAWRVGLFGLAHECYERAARRSILLYDDPPSWAQAALTQADEHLQTLGYVTRCGSAAG